MDLARKKYAVGDRIFNWKLLRIVGQGGMGVVFLAQHSLTGREAAVKIIYAPAGLRADEGAILRFRNEIEIHVRLKMPNLPEFLQAEMDEDGTCILVLEFIDGTDLERLLRVVKTLALGDALLIGIDVLRPLHVIHQTSIHRDIKPPNIMIRRRVRYDSAGTFDKGLVVLMDFGISKHQGRKGPTGEHVIVGSRFYMSPEQYRGLELTPKSDVYSVAGVIYEMLSGLPLFVRDPEEPPELIGLMFAHVHTPVPRLESVPDDVWAVLERMLAKEPEQRPTAHEACEALKDLRAKYLATSRIFRADVVDVAEATRVWMAERLRGDVEAPDATEVPSLPRAHQLDPLATATTEEAVVPIEIPPGETADVIHAAFARPPRAAAPDPEPAGLPARAGYMTGGSVGTFRMVDAHGGKPSRPPTERELRTVRWIRDVLRAPRLFRRPGVMLVDEQGRPLGEVREVKGFPCTLGGGANAQIRLEAAGAHQAGLSIARDQRLSIRPRDGDLVRLAIAGRTAAAGGELWHGVEIVLGRARFVVFDLVAHDPRYGRAQRFRQRDEPASFVFTREGKYVASSFSDFQLLLVGSSPACDIVLEEAGEIVAVVMKRADGEMEVVSLDSSALPYGDAIQAVRFVLHGESVDLGGGYRMTLSDPPEKSRVVSLAMAEPPRQQLPPTASMKEAERADEAVPRALVPTARTQRGALGRLLAWLKALFALALAGMAIAQPLGEDLPDLPDRKLSETVADSAFSGGRHGC